MRRLITAALLVTALTLASVATALGHVHGITPLGCMDNDPVHAGANRTNDTPAASANGGPITGLIPRDLGEARLTGGDGGRHSALC